MKDVKCPYCEAPQDIDHDDGYGWKEDETYQQECSECEKTFVYSTTLIYYYEVKTADCLNGGDHYWKRTFTAPVERTRMICSICGEIRPCTTSELAEVMQDHAEIDQAF